MRIHIASSQNAVENTMGTRGTAMLRSRARMTARQAATAGLTGRADLHMHSTYSDGTATVEQILEYTQSSTELDVIAITDHDTIEGALRARDLWSQGSYRFDVVVGEEVSTRDGHLLALFIEKRIPPDLSMEQSIERIHAQGGLAVVAHPLHPLFRQMSCQKTTIERVRATDGVWFDGIGTWNASFCGVYANGLAMSANRGMYGLSELGNSDAHALCAIGRGFSWFAGKGAQDIRRSLELGLTAPGGRLWGLDAYYHWLCYRLNGPRRQSAREVETAVHGHKNVLVR